MPNNLGYHNLYLGIYIMPRSNYLYHCILVDHMPIYICIPMAIIQFASFKPSYITSHPLSRHAYLNTSIFLSNICSTNACPSNT